MILVIYDKDQPRKNWYLIILKRIFLTGVRYLLIFTLERQDILKKADFADVRKWYNDMELKMFCKVLFLFNTFFFRFDRLKMKAKFEVVMVAFHPKLAADKIFNMTDKANLAFFQK